MVIVMIVEELDGGIMVNVVTEEESEMESELERNFKAAVKQQQLNCILEEQEKDEKAGKEDKEEKEQDEAEQRRLHMHRGDNSKRQGEGENKNYQFHDFILK